MQTTNTSKAGERTQNDNFVIRSTFRGNQAYFAAIHGYSAQFFTIDKARRFTTKEEAHKYAMAELFESEDAFVIETI